ncbi:MAG: TetR/AcrR family transcriptional regulator [Myxococcota bacterium]|nr:TetR/AcrR family transcriptional regulator [Myxococcota bacterium]
MELVERQMKRRRERILEAAREIIGQHGFEGLTMRQLAAASDVTVPTVYNLVGSKEEVLFAAVEEQTARFVNAIESSRSRSPAAGALAVVEACVRELLRRPRYYRSLLLLMFTSESASEVRREVNEALRGQFAQAVADLHEAGALESWVDREALARRLAAQLSFGSLQWASGAISGEDLRACAVYDASVFLLGACRGGSRRVLQRAARQSQTRVARRRRRANGAGRAASEGRS